MTSTLSRDVVDVTVGDWLSSPDEKLTQPARESACAVLEPVENAAVAVNRDEAEDLNLESYRVDILSVCRFKIVLGFILMWALFGVLLNSQKGLKRSGKRATCLIVARILVSPMLASFEFATMKRDSKFSVAVGSIPLR